MNLVPEPIIVTRHLRHDLDMDPAAYLPAELFHDILGYLDGNELAKTTGVNKLWNTLASDGVLWQSLCRSRWRGKRYMRRVYRMGKQIWSHSPRKWRWAYGQVEQESRRTTTTESEIVESYWKFTYTNGISNYNYPIFESNHTLIQPDIFPEPLTWQLLPGSYFLVSRIPPLYISRNRSTWAWTISNAFCLYVAVEHPGMEKRLFGGSTGEGDELREDDEEGGIDDVDEAAERRGAMPRRGDGGWVVF